MQMKTIYIRINYYKMLPITLKRIDPVWVALLYWAVGTRTIKEEVFLGHSQMKLGKNGTWI